MSDAAFWDAIHRAKLDILRGGSPTARPRASAPGFVDEHPERVLLCDIVDVPVPTYVLTTERSHGMLGTVTDYPLKAQREDDVAAWLDTQVDLGGLVILQRSTVQRTWGNSAAWIIGQAERGNPSGPMMLIGHVQEHSHKLYDRGGLPLERGFEAAPRCTARVRAWQWTCLATYGQDKPAPVVVPLGWGEQQPWSALRAVVFGLGGHA
jgi:hypothetical protein